MPTSVLVGVVMTVTSLALGRATVNRHIRGRLLLSSGLFAVYALIASGLTWFSLPDDTRQTLQAINPLLVVFAAINLVVTLSINPWGTDRVPERFPNIVQDTLVIALFAVVATLILRDRVMATTAVGAVVVGLALQDTLGNLFAGLAIQVEKPFRVGDWVTVGGHDGIVSEVTWRATKIRTKTNNLLVVPNSVLARDTITNYCLPTRALRLEVEVGASYEVAPNVVKSVIAEALKSARDISHERPPEILLAAFGASSITYRVRFWIAAFDPDDRAEDSVRSLIYYALKRNNIAIPYPIQVEMSADEGGVAPVRASVEADALAPVTLFSALTDDERAELVAIARRVMYAAGESIVRQGDSGESLFVVVRGEAAVTLTNAAGEVARLRAGDVFGEMSLLTGEARTATVTAIRDCDLLEIDAQGFRRAVLANPGVLERITAVAASRREEMERHQETHAMPAPAAEIRQSLLRRVRQFLRL